MTKPFFVLAPMDDVTDTVFRRIVSSCTPPDIYVTEFVNVDGLQSVGRMRLLPRVALVNENVPVIAQVWGKNPENFYKTAKEISNGTLAAEANKSIGGRVGQQQNFAGLDINFGCPDKNVVRNNTCSAMIKPENHRLALEIIEATKEGMTVGRQMQLSVKTRLGFNQIDLSWHELLLNQKLNTLTIHGRTRAEMSKVAAHWDKIAEIVQLRNKIAPNTKIVGNGDVMNRQQGLKLAKKTRVDGIMIGRGVFHDPYCFAEKSPWEELSSKQKIDLFRQHVTLFTETWRHSERKFETLRKFAKIYISGFDGASELRAKIMEQNTPDEVLALLANTAYTST